MVTIIAAGDKCQPLERSSCDKALFLGGGGAPGGGGPSVEGTYISL